MQNPFRCFNGSPEIIRLTVMMYIRYPLSRRLVEDLLLSAASTFATRRFASGGTGSARCSQRKSGNDGFSTVGIRTGAGTWTRFS
jgi:hypothetical protein